MRYYIALLAVLLVLGCTPNQKSNSDHLAALEKIYEPQYSKGFNIYKCDDGSSILEVLNPWQQAKGVSKLAFLSSNGAKAPSWFEGEVIDVPLQRVVCMSSSYVAFIDALGCDTFISGISGSKFISSPNVKRRIDAGKIADVGYDNSINYELLVSLDPDVILIYGVSGENSAITDKLRELGLRVMYIGDYLESTPLGKAEWIVPMGELLGHRAEAESLFNKIRTEYEQVAKLAKDATKRPSVMLNAPWRDSWFVPGDRSYMVRLIMDAGGEYVCRGVDSDQSRPISTETAFVAASQSDVWLNPGTVNNLAELLMLNPNFNNIPLVKNSRVFNNNARSTPYGGSDFWESGAVYPHLVLKDMIKILHPELLTEHQLYYFQQLK